MTNPPLDAEHVILAYVRYVCRLVRSLEPTANSPTGEGLASNLFGRAKKGSISASGTASELVVCSDEGVESDSKWNVTLLRICGLQLSVPLTQKVVVDAINSLNDQSELRGCLILSRGLELVIGSRNSHTVSDGKIDWLISACGRSFTGSPSVTFEADLQNIPLPANFKREYVKAMELLSEDKPNGTLVLQTMASWLSDHRIRILDVESQRNGKWLFSDLCNLLANQCGHHSVGNVAFFEIAFAIASEPSLAEQEVAIIDILAQIKSASPLAQPSSETAATVPDSSQESQPPTAASLNLSVKCQALCDELDILSSAKSAQLKGFNKPEFMELIESLVKLAGKLHGFGGHSHHNLSKSNKTQLHKLFVDLLSSENLDEVPDEFDPQESAVPFKTASERKRRTAR